MKSSSKTTQARRATKPETVEPFIIAAQRLGDALADALEHDDCPAELADVICDLETRIFNHHSDVAISLRCSFAQRLVRMLEQSA